MDFSPEDIMTPSPHIYHYQYEGKDHFYIPDLFIPSINAEVEIKDGGDNPNTHPKIQEVDKVKEKLKDEVMKSNGVPFNYVKVTNKNNMKFLKFLGMLKDNDEEKSNKKVVLI